jgi:hypothetical protein
VLPAEPPPVRLMNTIWAAAAELYAGGYGRFATNPTSHDIYQWFPVNWWSRVGGPGRQFAVTSEGLYGITPDGQAVARYDGTGTSWSMIGGPAERLYAGRYGLFATAPGSGDLYRYVDGRWAMIGRAGSDFAVTNESVYRVDVNGQGSGVTTGPARPGPLSAARPCACSVAPTASSRSGTTASGAFRMALGPASASSPRRSRSRVRTSTGCHRTAAASTATTRSTIPGIESDPRAGTWWPADASWPGCSYSSRIPIANPDRRLQAGPVDVSAAEPVRVRLLGPVDSGSGSGSLCRWIRHASSPCWRTCCCIVLRRSRASGGVLLWPGSTERQAQTNLRKVLHTLRHAAPDVGRLL